MVSSPEMTRDELLQTFPRARTWLLPALRAVQQAERWLAPEALRAVAAHLRVPASEVWGVASHYPELRMTPPGARLVRVCTGVSCQERGGDDVMAACERQLGIRAGETTPDGAVTLEALDCAFACASAPVVEVDHAYRGRIAVAEVPVLLASPAPAPHPTPATRGSRACRWTGARRWGRPRPSRWTGCSRSAAG